MAGIVKIGSYIPWYRLTGETLAAQYGGSKKGSRAVANHDEDSITLAVEAARNAIGSADASGVDGLYFASTTMPYAEKGNAAFVATAANLGYDAFAADFGGTLRSATLALRSARDAVAAGSARSVVVTAADIRSATPGDPNERTLGDAAAAVVIGDKDVIAEIIDIRSTNHEFIDVWRNDDDEYLNAADTKFIQDAGYTQFMAEAAKIVLEKNGIKPEAIAKVAAFSPDGKFLATIARSLKIAPEKCVNLLDIVGDSGSANALLALVSAIESSAPGDIILALSHSSGADAILLKVTDKVKSLDKSKSVLERAKRSKNLTSYAKFLQFRDILPREEVRVWSAPPVLWREERENYRLMAKKCNKCGAIQYPIRRICWNCSTQDDMSEQRLGDRAKVFTFTKDYLPPNPDSPTIMVSADIDGGGRFYTQLTDCDPKDVKIDLDVEFTLRRIHQGGGINHYFWKFKPVV